MLHRLEIGSKLPDPRSQVIRQKLLTSGYTPTQLQAVEIVDVYTLEATLDIRQLERIGAALTSPVAQYFLVDSPIEPAAFVVAVEIGFLPGVTDNVATTARQTILDLLGEDAPAELEVYSSRLFFFRGELLGTDGAALGMALANPLIERIHVKSRQQFQIDRGMDRVIPRVTLSGSPHVDVIPLQDMSETELTELGKRGIADLTPTGKTHRGPLALGIESMRAIQKHFAEVEKRDPTDAELEMLAQTWSEHCKHTLFASPIDEIQSGLYKHYIKRATEEIRAKRGAEDICVSVFKDNSGAIILDENWLITDKVETHNSPSALDPYGGAITGIVGVNRDCLGFGQGAKPIVNRYGFCLADPEDETPLYRGPNKTFPMLSSRRIMDGVISGVASGGNQSGIPAPQGFLYFDSRYRGKPLVFAGTVGLIPRQVAGRPGFEKTARPGDKIVVIGGRVGKDGIHGATFSSEALDTGSPVTAVQIGDPITQKKLSDAIVKEARDLGLIQAITDNGAGGLASSIGEMARDSGGCEVKLERVPLKYPGLQPWEIWISESQERMTLAVAPEHIEPLFTLLNKRDVEATVIGTFTTSGRCTVTYNGDPVVNLDMEFLHDGVPLLPLTTTQPAPPTFIPSPVPKTQNPEPNFLLSLLSRPSIRSFAFVSNQYDHLVQGGAALQPLQGPGKVNADATVYRPLVAHPYAGAAAQAAVSQHGVITSQALFPSYSEIDPRQMALLTIDQVVRQVLAVGGELTRLALCDNFCWCSPDAPERLWQLKAAAAGCYEGATAYGTPFISGKDSMYNDFKGYDAAGDLIHVAIPPTLLISALGVMAEVERTVSLDPKLPGDLVYLLGQTRADELAGSEYERFLRDAGQIGADEHIGKLPEVNAESFLPLYAAVEQATAQGLLSSALAIGRGGLGVALAKSVVAGRLGLEITPVNDAVFFAGLYAESAGRFLVTIDPAQHAKFEQLFAGLPCEPIGSVTDNDLLTIGAGLKVTLTDLEAAYHHPTN